MDWDRRPGLPTLQDYPRTPSGPWPTKRAGPSPNCLPVPQDGGDGGEDTDPLAPLKSDIAAAKGNALLVETTSGGWQRGQGIRAPV